jgi:hypothetical protein
MRTACCVALAIILGTADRVWACSCFEFSSCSLYAAADAVFLGEVVDARVENRQLVARMRVTRVWKGTVDRLVTVSNPADSSCSFPFTVGTRYVVYGGGTGGAFVTYVCAGGGQLRPGEPEPDLPPVSGSVTGTIARYKKVIVDRDDLSDPVVGVRVWVKSGRRVIETHSDTSGAFTLRGVGAGDHTVHADFGDEEEGSARVSLRSAEDCGTVLIMPSPSGRIVGVLRSGDGHPIRETELHAIPLDHDWMRYDLTRVWNATSGQNGAFEFTGVPPGEYVLGLNVFGPAMVKQPFPPTYYPGVERREDATIISVGAGQPQPAEPFLLKRTLPRTVIVADIVCRDGSIPLSGLVYAQQVAPHSFFSESTYEQIDGHFRLTVMHGVPYDVHGEVLIPARDASGQEMGITSLRTPAVRIDSGAPPSIIRLIAPLDRCEQTTIDGSRPP